MKKIFISLAAMSLVSCFSSPSPSSAVADKDGRVVRMEPLSWWTGMRTPLQLLVYGPDISACEVEVAGDCPGLSVAGTHRADSPNYLFVDVKVDPKAEPGTYYFIFSREGAEPFKVPYEIAARREGSRERESSATADMIYLVMPDRFADGDPSIDSTDDTAEKAARSEFFGRHGGDLQGMIDHLDYIASVGATTVWSTPPLPDDEPVQSYHGYACGDYYRIDPRFGTNELYRTYVAECHKRDLKVVMDIVTNHCGISHWWMKDLPFADWVHRFPEFTRTNNLFSTNMDPNASQYDLHVQESGWFDTSMPDMNLDNPYLLHYFKQWAVWWIEWADLDGLRVDTYPYNEKAPMSSWCEAVRAEYPNINIVGECWTGSIPQLAYWQGGNPNRDGFDSHLPSIMDFPLRDAICSALAGASRLRLSRPFEDDDLRGQPRHGAHRRHRAQESRPGQAVDGAAGYDARHSPDSLRRGADAHLGRPQPGARRSARRLPRRLGGRSREPLRPRPARSGAARGVRLHAAAVPVAQDEAGDPSWPHAPLRRPGQHLRLFPL